MNRQKAIIVDIDGTLSDNSHRLHMFNDQVKDWTFINEQSRYDLPHEWCQNMVHMYSDAGYKIIFLTGRSQEAEGVTREWLTRYISPAVDWVLMMRHKDDHREDWICKEDIYFKEIAPLYEVQFCLEDRESVTNMWRRIGLICLQCKESTY